MPRLRTWSRLGAVGLAMAAALALATPGVAGSHGDVTFRLTLRGGPIPESDDFSLAINDLTPPETVISPGFLCGPGSENYNPAFVACEARDYDWVIGTDRSFEIGDEFSYGFAKDGQTLRRGTVSLAADSQVVSVVYDYDTGRVLPDTSTRETARTERTARVAGSILSGIVVLISALLAASCMAARTLRRPVGGTDEAGSTSSATR